MRQGDGGERRKCRFDTSSYQKLEVDVKNYKVKEGSEVDKRNIESKGVKGPFRVGAERITV